MALSARCYQLYFGCDRIKAATNLQTTEEDGDAKQEVTASLATAKEISILALRTNIIGISKTR